MFVGGAGQTVSLSSNVNFNDDTALCPGTLVEFECVGINVEALQWRSNQTLLVVYTLASNGQIDTDIQPSRPPGFNFTLTSVEFNVNQQSVNLTVIMTVELSALDSGTQIECLRGSRIQAITVTYSITSK